MDKFKEIWKYALNIFSVIKEHTLIGYKWIGSDGLLNLETAALLMVVLTLIFPVIASAFITIIIMCTKCIGDSLEGRENEEHDLICSIIGLVFGIIICIA